MKLLRLNLVITFLSLTKCLAMIQCDWNLEFLCGDKCVNFEKNGICYCGDDILDHNNLTDISNNVCCNDGPCKKGRKEDVYCLGTKQEVWLPCHGDQCYQTASWGYNNYLCQDQKYCFLRINSCQGKAQCQDQSDLQICSSEQETMKCGDNVSYDNCDQIEGSKYQNFGCKKQDSKTLGSFHCANRKDKEQVLFGQPPVPLKQTNRGRNYNRLLEYDDTYVYCNENSRISYAEIMDLGLSHSGNQIKCHLKNGENLTLRVLFIDLAVDFSFEMNYKFHEFYHEEIMKQLEDQCLLAPNAFQCGPNSTYCTYDYKLCDGIANCPNGEDEEYEVCKEHFSTYASIKCNEKDVFNMAITIGATPCDGFDECQGDIDEIDCNMPDIYSVLLLVLILVITSGLATIMKKMTLESLEPILEMEQQSWTQHELEAMHGKDHLKILMYQVQNSNEATKINQNFIQMEINQHNGVKSEIICCIKTALDPCTTSKVMNQFHGQNETFASIAKILEYHLEQLSMIKMILNAASYTMDLAKDSLILIQISLSQGGLSFILEQPTPYFKGMFFFLLASIIIPFILGTLRFIFKGGSKLLFANKNVILRWIGMVLTIPIFPVFLIMKEAILVEASRKYQVCLNLLKDVKYHSAQFIQADLGLESHLQSVFTIAFVLLAISETRTIVGFEVLFENTTIFYLPTKLALGCSILWSLYSCISSHLKGISKRRDYSTFASFFILLAFTTISVTIRTFSYILFLTPCLGLWNCLRHLQGEMYPFLQPYNSKVNVSNEMFHFGNAPIIPWSKITRWKYIGYENAEPPHYTLYTWLTIEQYFFVLLGLLGLNIAWQIVAKKRTNPDVYHKQTFLDVLIHGISCCFIPHPMEEWDEEQGGVMKHKLRKDLVFIEMFVSIVVNFGFNAFLLSPQIILAINIFDRHGILVNSIGAFPEEIQAYEQIKVMLGASYGLLVIGTVLQVGLYHLYNGQYHPFALILDQKNKTIQDDDEVESYGTAVESLSTTDSEDFFYDILYTELAIQC